MLNIQSSLEASKYKTFHLVRNLASHLPRHEFKTYTDSKGESKCSQTNEEIKWNVYPGEKLYMQCGHRECPLGTQSCSITSKRVAATARVQYHINCYSTLFDFPREKRKRLDSYERYYANPFGQKHIFAESFCNIESYFIMTECDRFRFICIKQMEPKYSKVRYLKSYDWGFKFSRPFHRYS